MFVSYKLSSDDVKLTLDLLVDGVSYINYTLLANESEIEIPKPDAELSISVQFTASRYLASTAAFESARVSSVAFRTCLPTAVTG